MTSASSPDAPCISFIVAMDEAGLIGRDGDLPWRLPEDLKNFRRLTMGKTLLMGRRTFDSLGKPLDGRDNWVLSRDPAFAPAGVRVFASVAAALEAFESGELMVIGGADLYRQLLPRCNRVYRTRVHATVEGDTHFAELDQADFEVIASQRHAADARHPHDFTFETLQRRLPAAAS